MSLEVDKVRDAGIVGCGGAGFPTHVKLAARADTFIANGAECEPLLECDRHAMLRHPTEIVEGMTVAMGAVGARQGILAVKAKHDDVIAVLGPIVDKTPNLRLGLLPDVYPMGDEQVLLHELTGRLVPPGGLPLNVGIVVQNVHTLLAIARAQHGVPFTHRWVTVGGLVASPATFVVPVGTPAQVLLDAVGGLTRPDAVLINGGPMTGQLLPSAEAPVTKTMGGLLALPPESLVCREKRLPVDHHRAQSRFACFQCQDCTRVCPRFLLGFPFQPHLVMRAVNYPAAEVEPVLQSAHYCCDCGLCSLVGCQTMNLSPRRICCDLKGKVPRPELPPGWQVAPNPMREDVAVPSRRLLRRHGLEPFAGHGPLREAPLEPSAVVLLLKQHIGAPAQPVVEVGQRVALGDLVAAAPAKGVGACIHASIAGTVTHVTDREVRIHR